MTALIRGIDVSIAQGTIQWPLVAKDPANIKFAIVKGYEGNKGLDPHFARNVQGARSEGLEVGCYNFVYPLPNEPGQPFHPAGAQCSLHFDNTGGLGQGDGDLGPFVDAEWPAPEDWAKWKCSATQIRTWLLDYLVAAEAIYHKPPTVYTYPDWWKHIDGASEPAFGRYDLWMASYREPARWPVEGEIPFVPAPWTKARWWQTSGGTMRVAGMIVDTDVRIDD